MDYNDLKPGKIWMYVPTLKQFHKMEVVQCVAPAKEGFTISNYSLGKNGLIQGHEYLAFINNQESLDNFFYHFEYWHF